MAPTRSYLLFLVAVCSLGQLTTGASLQTLPGLSQELAQGPPVPSPSSEVPVPVVPSVPTAPAANLHEIDVDDLIEDPAFLEELLKNINNTSSESEIDDVTSTSDDNSATTDDNDNVSVDGVFDDDNSKEKKYNVNIYEVLHSESKESVDDDDSNSRESMESMEHDDDADDYGNESGGSSTSGGTSSNSGDNDLFDILTGDDGNDDMWSRAQLAKRWNTGAMSEQCPPYPVRIQDSQIIISTGDGCEIVIELAGQGVKKVSRMPDGSFQMKSTKVSSLMDDDNSNEISEEVLDNTSNEQDDIFDDNELIDDDIHDNNDNSNDIDDQTIIMDVTDTHSDDSNTSVGRDDTHDTSFTDDVHDDTNNNDSVSDTTSSKNSNISTATDDKFDDKNVGDDTSSSGVIPVAASH